VLHRLRILSADTVDEMIKTALVAPSANTAGLENAVALKNDENGNK
jgi:hypothetical protein